MMVFYMPTENTDDTEVTEAGIPTKECCTQITSPLKSLKQVSLQKNVVHKYPFKLTGISL